ncbi:MAG TPA: hypothetical protein VN688_30460 [Gemmataceae bacterium]|nr:hypothetical protein [Gemmataceae bacterium]
MPRNICLLVVAGLLAAAAPIRVEDAYTIKTKRDGKGDVVTKDEQKTETSHFKVEGPDGKLLKNEKKEQTTMMTYKETIVEKEKGKKATKLRRAYTKAFVKTIEGDKTTETTLPYQGKTILIEKKDGKYHFSIEGGEELTGEDAELLDKSFNKEGDDSDDEEIEKALFPKKPVRVGESWKLDAVSLWKSFEKGTRSPFPLDKAKASGTGKLRKAYKKNGAQFGVLDFSVTMPIKGQFPLGKNDTAAIQDGSKMKVHIEVDTCIDGTLSDGAGDITTDIAFTAVFKGPGGKDYKMMVSGTHKEKSTEKDLSKE